MNNGTRIRTLLAIATSLNTALMATDLTGFSNPTVDLIYKIASVVLNFIIVACVTYYNNDYTVEAAIATGLMRLKKAEKSATETIGEDFFNDPDFDIDDEEEDEEEEDYDEEELAAAESEEEQPPLEEKFGDKEGEE